MTNKPEVKIENKRSEAVNKYLETYQSLFISGKIGLIDIIRTNAKLAILAQDLTKEERAYTLRQIDKI